MKPHIKVIQRDGIDVFVTSNNVICKPLKNHHCMWWSCAVRFAEKSPYLNWYRLRAEVGRDDE